MKWNRFQCWWKSQSIDYSLKFLFFKDGFQSNQFMNLFPLDWSDFAQPPTPNVLSVVMKIYRNGMAARRKKIGHERELNSSGEENFDSEWSFMRSLRIFLTTCSSSTHQHATHIHLCACSYGLSLAHGPSHKFTFI